MSRFVPFCLLLFFSIASSASTVEVLYVAEPQGSQSSLLTYNVNPQTAAAQQVGQAVTVGASSVDPLTLGTTHLIYIWNGTDVWAYTTNTQGVPSTNSFQHLSFNFSYPVNAFLIDPNGKYAYAAMTWLDSKGNSDAAIALFTINQSTGALTNTNQMVARYGPNLYTGLNGFVFGKSGARLYASWLDDGPYTSIRGYSYYSVNQSTGQLGPLRELFYAQAYECGTTCAVAITDVFSAEDGVCCGPGSGNILINRTATNQQVGCGASDLAFCGDDVATLNFDPSNRNLFFGDATVSETFIGQIDLSAAKLIQSSSTIPGTPPLYFSPDSKLLYAVNSNNIGIYAFQASSGQITASSSLSDSGNVSVATTTLRN